MVKLLVVVKQAYDEAAARASTAALAETFAETRANQYTE
jgi:hypothetical protein